MNNLSKPRVSVIIPVYNAVNYLRQSIESVITQAGINIELIVVDDGSNDGSQEIVRSYPSIRLIEQNRQGACKARNIGLSNATADFVKFLDADDYLEPEIIRKQLEFLDKSGDREITYSDIRFFNDNTDCSVIKVFEFDQRNDQVTQLFKTNIQTSAPLHRRKLLLEVGGFDERLMRAQEYNLHIRLAMAGCRFVRLPGVGTHIRDHASPHRITNQRSGQLVEDNAELRRQIYVELLQRYYDDVIPRALRQYFVSNAVENALTQMRHGDMEGARKALARMTSIKPTFFDLILGGVNSLGRIGRLKIAYLTQILVRQFNKKGGEF